MAVTRLLCVNGNVAFKDDRVPLNLVLVNCSGFDHLILNHLINTVAMVYTSPRHELIGELRNSCTLTVEVRSMTSASRLLGVAERTQNRHFLPLFTQEKPRGVEKTHVKTHTMTIHRLRHQ